MVLILDSVPELSSPETVDQREGREERRWIGDDLAWLVSCSGIRPLGLEILSRWKVKGIKEIGRAHV